MVTKFTFPRVSMGDDISTEWTMEEFSFPHYPDSVSPLLNLGYD